MGVRNKKEDVSQRKCCTQRKDSNEQDDFGFGHAVRVGSMTSGLS